jgi:alkylated DNA repair dioxygenase AlkB
MPPDNLLPRDGILALTPHAIAEADQVFERLRTEIDWRQETATLFGRRIPVPRLVAWHGDAGYGYSGIRHEPRPWTPALLDLKRIAEREAGVPFNSVLLNLYRDGRDSMGWHADDERELGPEPIIASLSLGAVRMFQARHRQDKTCTLSLPLPPGSCLVMAGGMQAHWHHQIPKTARPVAPRINLTFRMTIRLLTPSRPSP